MTLLLWIRAYLAKGGSTEGKVVPLRRGDLRGRGLVAQEAIGLGNRSTKGCVTLTVRTGSPNTKTSTRSYYRVGTTIPTRCGRTIIAVLRSPPPRSSGASRRRPNSPIGSSRSRALRKKVKNSALQRFLASFSSDSLSSVYDYNLVQCTRQ